MLPSLDFVDLFEALKPVFNMTGHRHRRVWSRGGRAYVELRELSPNRLKVFTRRLRSHLLKKKGIKDIKVDPTTWRAIVIYEQGRYKAWEIRELLDEAERAIGLSKPRFLNGQAEHPVDVEPIIRTSAELLMGVMALVAALILRYAPLKPKGGSLDLSAIFALMEHAPKIRHLLDERLGKESSELLLVLLNSILQALSQGTMGPFVGIIKRYSQLSEMLARREVWIKREMEFYASLPPVPPKVNVNHSRPEPLPPGPIEKYADEGLSVSLGAFGAALAETHKFESASAAIFGGLPKSVVFGRDFFISTLTRALADRGIVIMKPEVLRLLDRVDTVIVQEELIATGNFSIGEVVPVGKGKPSTLRHQVSRFFDSKNVMEVKKHGEWKMGPLRSLGIKVRDAHRRVARKINVRGTPVLGLTRHGRLQAIIETYSTGQLVFEEILALGRKNGFNVIIAAKHKERVSALGADHVIKDGNRLPAMVRRYQREGKVVCVIDWSEEETHGVADFGIGIRRLGQNAFHRAPVLCNERLDDAVFLMKACVEARKVSHQSVKLALLGVGLGTAHAARGLQMETTRQVASDMNLASLLTMANGLRVGLRLSRQPQIQRRDPTPWHALEKKTVLNILNTSLEEGLSLQDVARRRRERVRKPSPLLQFGKSVLTEIRSPLMPLMAAGASLSAVVGSIVDASLVAGVFSLNGVIGGAQRFMTERSIHKLDYHRRKDVTVIRNKREYKIAPEDLVSGDIIHLRAGEVAPADARILKAVSLEMDESTLTGESLPVKKSEGPSYAPSIADRTSMIYEGTSVAAGEVMAVVTAIGDQTESRRGMALARGQAPESGVEVRLESLTAMTIPISLFSGAALAGMGMVRNQPIPEVLNMGVSLAVAAVPEGLPILATVAQLAAANRLAAKKVYVRNPRSIEAMGRINILFSDKTGTLTEGRLKLYGVSDGIVTEPTDKLSTHGKEILSAALRASPVRVPRKKFPHLTDQAIVDGGRHAGVGEHRGAKNWKRVDELPFESSRGYHVVLGKLSKGHLLSVKGAPEILIPHCQEWQQADGIHRMTLELKKRLMDQGNRLAGEGYRVLAVVERRLGQKRVLKESLVRGLIFRGFVMLSDPVRPSAAKAVEHLKQAGVEVVMVTGDHPNTAARIAATLNLLNGHRVLTGPEMEAMTDKELDETLPNVSVLARVTPLHKVRVVKAMQRLGKIVAMTGDGANDAAAIRLANVGIAIGGGRNAAAQDAADIIVSDDRIETVVDAIAEGRALWASVRDAVSILVGGNMGEIGFTLAAGIFASHTPLNARQLLLVNLLTDVAPAMAIALRPPAQSSLLEKLREGPDFSLGQALNRDIAWRAGSTMLGASTAWLWARLLGSREKAETVGLLALVGSQLGQTLVSGGRDPLVALAGLGSAAVVTAIVEIPGLSQFFGCRPLGPLGLSIAASSSALATGTSVIGPRLIPTLDHLTDRIGSDWLKEKMQVVFQANRKIMENVREKLLH